MKAGWTFDRGVTPVDGGETPIRCRFQTEDESGAARSAMEFTIPESAVLDMIEALRKVASPLTVATNGNGVT